MGGAQAVAKAHRAPGGIRAPFTNPPASWRRCGFGSAASRLAAHGTPTLTVVRHATPAGLERISDLLATLRAVNGLVERRPGVFYRRSRAFLHFHEDPTGMFADVRLAGDDFVRLRVTSRAEQASLPRQVRRAVGEPPA